ncbi:hypothetical protein BD779DRAFT_1718679, partial [Infundibulicybe gibba]
CPELRTFALQSPYSITLTIVNFDAPWQQLTTLQFHTQILAYECLDIVRRCTSLQECDVSISIMSSRALQRITELSRCPIVLPSLHTLQIQFSDSENDNFMFLRALRLPGLRKFQPVLLELSGWLVHPTPWSLSVLQSVLCNTIQELDLSKFPIHESMSGTLARMSNVGILWLSDDSPGIMHALGEGTIAPRLTTLHLCYVESLDSLFDILEARVSAARANSGVTALVNVTIRDRCDDPKDGARLLALTEAGMKIDFRSDPLW